jgi:hypothetical protein
MLHGNDFHNFLGGQFVRQSCDIFSDNSNADCAARGASDLLCGDQRFEAGVIPFALPLFRNDEYFHG